MEEGTFKASIGEGARIGNYSEVGLVPAGKELEELVLGRNANIRSHTVIYAGSRIGDNFQTGHNAVIREGNIIGDDCAIGSNTTMEIGNVLGDRVKVHSNCIIGEFVHMEDDVWVGPSVITLATLHPPCPKYKDCAGSHHITIKRNTKVGGSVVISPGITIGENCLIGCGAVLTRDVPDDMVAVGNPAKVLKRVDELDCIMPFYDKPYEWEERK